MNKTSVGIDPGKDGFIVLISESEGVFSWPVPKIGNAVDLNELNNIFKTISTKCNVHCVLEQVHAIQGSGAKGTFEFGRIYGIMEALLIANSISHTKIQPKKWQKEMHEGIPIQKKQSSTGKTTINDTKKMSLIAAKQLFPLIDLRKSEKAKNPDHNKVDALLIAEYCRRKY